MISSLEDSMTDEVIEAGWRIVGAQPGGAADCESRSQGAELSQGLHILPLCSGDRNRLAHRNRTFVVGGTSTIGAAGNTPKSPFAGRADPSPERGHWAFDQDAYRRDMLARVYDPRSISAVLVILTAFCAVLMVAVALGAAG